MKNIIFSLLLVFAFSAQASITIVSDLDDTIKITEAGGNATDIIGDDVYTGMPEFLAAAKEYSPTLYVLSASPSIMRSKIASTLKKRKVIYNGLVLRSNITEGKFEYKVREIKKLMEQSSDDFIFLGDDLGKDPEAYSEIARQFPGRVLGIYIHVVNGRKITSDSVPYWTSFDLTLREFEASRMTPGWVEKIIDLLKSEAKLQYIFPKKAQCPSEASVWEWQTRTIFMQEAQDLIERFTSFCQARQSDNILL